MVPMVDLRSPWGHVMAMRAGVQGQRRLTASKHCKERTVSVFAATEDQGAVECEALALAKLALGQKQPAIPATRPSQAF